MIAPLHIFRNYIHVILILYLLAEKAKKKKKKISDIAGKLLYLMIDDEEQLKWSLASLEIKM